MTMQPTRLSAIKKHQKPVPVQIRVIKKWPLPPKQELCYLFVDKHADGIEAIAGLNQEAHFESIIDMKSCYTITNYIVIENRKFRPILEHEASLMIGKKTRFEPLLTDNIPYHFFQFTSYDELHKRMSAPWQLTDFIGIIDNNKQKETNTGKMLRKVDIRDVRGNRLQITLWPAKAHLLGDNAVPGDIIAITSALVTEYDNMKQLESNYPTEIYVNPTFPDVQQHIHRLKELPPVTITTVSQKKVTLHELLSNPSTCSTSQVTCTAQIKEIYASRNWYYVRCSMCNNKLQLERGDSTYYVCKDHDDTKPRFMYCVNASLMDSTAATNVIFFNEVMTDIMGTSCIDMVILHGNTDPKILPADMLSKIGVPMIFSLTVKANSSIVVTKAININQDIPPSATAKTSSTVVPSTITPVTPDPKSLVIKRPRDASPDDSLKKVKI